MRVVGRLGVGEIHGGRLVRRWGVARQGQWGRWAAGSRRWQRRPDGRRLGAVERQIGEVRCLARAEAPPAEGGSGWRRILSAIAVASRTGPNRPPPLVRV